MKATSPLITALMTLATALQEGTPINATLETTVNQVTAEQVPADRRPQVAQLLGQLHQAVRKPIVEETELKEGRLTLDELLGKEFDPASITGQHQEQWVTYKIADPSLGEIIVAMQLDSSMSEPKAAKALEAHFSGENIIGSIKIRPGSPHWDAWQEFFNKNLSRVIT